MEKIIKPVISALVIGLVISCAIQSCKTITHGKPIYTMPLVVYYPLPRLRDTTPKVHVLTETERQVLLDKYYQYNYEKYFLPEFKSLRDIIGQQQLTLNNQAYTNKQMVDILQNMRQRSIKSRDSFQKVEMLKDSKYGHLMQTYNDEQKKQVERNAIQINSLNTLADILLVIAVIMIFCIIGLLIAVRVLWIRMNNIYKKVSHA